MARVALGVAGAVVGTLVLPGAGTAIGLALSGATSAAIGFAVGSAIGDYLFAPTTKSFGPKLDDLSVQGSSYGASIPQIWGAFRLAGQVVWSDGITEHEEKSSSGGGGKGGGGGGSSHTTYRYTASFAVLLCEGPVAGIRRIWADAMLIYDVSAEGSDEAILAANFATAEVIERVTLYRGTEDQMPDPLLASSARYKDKAAPAYRGRVYLVFENLELEKFGKRIPSISVELFTAGTGGRFLPTKLLEVQQTRGTNYATSNDIVYSHELPADGREAEVVPVAVYKHRFGEEARISKSLTVAWPELPASEPVRPLVGGSSDRWYFAAFDSASDVWVMNLHEKSLQGVTALSLGFTSAALAAYTRFEIRNQTIILGYNAGAAVGVQVWVYRYVWEDAQWTLEHKFENRTVPAASGAAFNIYGATLDELHDVALDATGERGFYLRFETRGGVAEIAVVYQFAIGSADPPQELWVMTADDRATFGALAVPSLTSSSDGLRVIVGPLMYTLGFDGLERNIYLLERLGTNATSQHQLVNGVAVAREGDAELWHVPKQPDKDTVALTRIIGDVASQCRTTIDASDIDGLSVSGYMRGKPMPGRAVVEPLQQVHTFDIVEHAAAMRVVKRGGAAVLTVNESAIVSDRDFEKKRAQEIELPRRLVAQYLSAQADFQAGTQQAQRIATRSIVEAHVELPVVLTDDEAAQVAEVLLHAAWQSRETIANLSLPPEYSRLEPADVIELQADNATRRVRLTKVGFTAPGLLDVAGTVEDQDVYTSEAVGGLVGVNEAVLRFAGSTDLLVLDTHLLGYGHHDSGVYVAAYGGAQWNGAALYASANETNWQQVATLETAAKTGVTLEALAPGPTEVRDLGNTLRVKMFNGTLASTDDVGFHADVNAALVGEEVITFRDATLVAPQTYELSILSRGRHGTEPHMAHGASEPFVLLTRDLVDVSIPADAKGSTIYFRAVALGQRLDAEESVELVFTNHRQRPWSVAQFAVARVDATSVRASWIYRSRWSGAWSDGHDVPVVDTPETYRVEVFRPNPPLDDRRVLLEEITDREIVIDVDVGDRIEVAQLSESWGAGYPVTHTVT